MIERRLQLLRRSPPTQLTIAKKSMAVFDQRLANARFQSEVAAQPAEVKIREWPRV
jgi:hypothetical protein